MPQPRSLSEQRLAHCRGEIHRGNGIWPSFWTGCELEPPFEQFAWSKITRWDLCINGFDFPYQGQFIDRLKRLFHPAPAPSLELNDSVWERQAPPYITLVQHYAEDEISYASAEQFLLALGSAKDPLVFELFGIGPSKHRRAGPARIETRFVSTRADVPLLEAQLHNCYPRSAIVTRQYDGNEADCEWEERLCGEPDRQDQLCVAPLYLAEPYCFPIRTYSKFLADPLSPAIAVMDELRQDEWALLQVFFSRARRPWAENLRSACEDPYRRGNLMIPKLDWRLLQEKLESPLYAVAVILAANRPRILASLGSWVHQFDGSHNQLRVRDAAAWARQWSDNSFPDPVIWRPAVCSREILAPGMLLNVRELVSILHLPIADIPSDRLLRIKTRTQQPPVSALQSSAVLVGANIHRGKIRRVAIPPEIRSRHCYIAGASGTGKSTLLLNMILQDIEAGRGVGLLDPHGDLVKEVLRRIPEKRTEDVVLFDAADTEYPFALNILDAQDEAERERIVAETIMALERYFPASWGPRLERILQYTIRTVLHAVPNATLADVERVLTDPEYRETIVEKTRDPRLIQFWTNQFRFFPKNATDPVLNKISVFLLDRHVRNITCQRHAAINFDSLLNDGKILLANLSTGLLTEKVAGTLGSFLVTKIVNAAFRRAGIPESRRRPWFLYIDEFQSFMNLSVGFERILAESRKYKLVLAGLANQYVGQLSQTVRQAVFGNVGTMIVFRLGVEDAQAVAKELGVFTAPDILNLEIGEAIARVGGSSAAFNLMTFREPAAPAADPTRRVIALTRKEHARPRREVEAELAEVARAAGRLERAVARDQDQEPSDPNEDDLVT